MSFLGTVVSALYFGFALAVLASLPYLYWRRRRALSDPRVSEWRASPMAPLGRSERALLAAWHRRSVAGFAFTMALLPVIVLVSAMRWASDLAVQSALLALLGCAGAGVFHQFSRRCPRCGMNIGLTSRLGLPERCERCHVRFRSE